MRKLLLITLLSSSVTFAQNYEWTKRIGGSGDDRGNVIKVDGSGNVYVAGAFSGTVDFDPGSGTTNLTSTGDMDLYVAKYDGSGDLLWAKRDGDVFDDFVVGLEIDAMGNAYITGYGEVNSTGSQRALFVAKLDPSGNSLWDQTFTSSSQNVGGYALTVDGAGNVYVGGNFNGTVNFDTSGGTTELTTTGPNVTASDAFILKLTTGGLLQWVKQFGASAANVNILGITLDGSGNIYTTGQYWNSSLDCDPGLGTAYLGNVGGGDIFISKLDANGDYVWAKSFGGGNNEYGLSIGVDANGNVFTTGYFEGTVDFDPGSGTQNLTSVGSRDIYISKLDSNGDFDWVRAMGGADNDLGTELKLDAMGNIYSIGYFEGAVDFDAGTGTNNLTAAGDRDVYVTKMNNNGDFVWAQNVGSSAEDIGNSLFLDDDNNIFTVGNFNGTVDFDFGSGNADLSSSGSRDIFFTKWNQTYAGIESSNSSQELHLYPNPTSGFVQFNRAVDQVKVYGINGRLIHVEVNVNSLDLSHLTKGLYLVEINTLNSTQTERLIIE